MRISHVIRIESLKRATARGQRERRRAHVLRLHGEQVREHVAARARAATARGRGPARSHSPLSCAAISRFGACVRQASSISSASCCSETTSRRTST